MLPMLLLQCYNAITADTMLQPHVQWCNRAYNANATPPPRAARRVAFAGSSFSNIYPTNTAATARSPDPCGALNSVRFLARHVLFGSLFAVDATASDRKHPCPQLPTEIRALFGFQTLQPG